MYPLKLSALSCLLVTSVGIATTSVQATNDFAPLSPIVSFLLDNESNNIVEDNVGGNFVVSSRAFDDTVPEVNCDQVFTSTGALEDAAVTTLAPGTTLCLADGIYRSLELNFGGAGTKDAPITVAAQNPGQAIIDGLSDPGRSRGEMGVNMTGTYVVLQGIVFRNGNSASSDFLQTRSSGVACNYCRVTEISVIDMARTIA